MNAIRTVASATVCSMLAAGGGYWLGFRQAWNIGLMADAPVKGTIALVQMRMLELGRTDDFKVSLDSEIDSGLMWWAKVDEFPLRKALNILSGQEVIPDHEWYVKRIASYRKSHPSRLDDPKLITEMQASARADPDFANDLVEGGKEERKAVSDAIKRYAE